MAGRSDGQTGKLGERAAAVAPFLKWPGGKRWLVPEVRRAVSDLAIRRYFEPFLGGGAVFFGLRPPAAVLTDVNPDLINTYQQVAARPEALIERLQELPVDAQTYSRLRAFPPSDPVERAVRFLYLNRTAFGGMYRLNRRGDFNVPFGGGQRTPTPLWRAGLLVEASEALRGGLVQAADFGESLLAAGDGDLVYCDPTYTVAHNGNGFVRYNERNFSWGDQVRLANACAAAAARGATVMVSNAHHPDVARLYPDAEARTLDRMSLLCPSAQKRARTQEYLFILEPFKRRRQTTPVVPTK